MKKKLLRNPEKGILAGVCAGLGDFFNITPWLFRVIFILPVLPFILSFSAGVVSIVVYILCALFIPVVSLQKDKNIGKVEYQILEDEEEEVRSETEWAEPAEPADPVYSDPPPEKTGAEDARYEDIPDKDEGE